MPAALLVRLAAKYLARGDLEREAAIRRQLQDPQFARDAPGCGALLRPAS
ncbi:hypothetical protein [Actinoplanes sp. GCM10030250]